MPKKEVAPSPNRQIEAKSHSIGGTNADDEEKKKMHRELHSLIDKYEEIAKKMGPSSSLN